MRTLYIAALAVAAAVAADDPGGWSKAKWGMTEPQLADAFGPDIAPVDPPEKIAGVPVHLAVNVDIGGTPFRALLCPDRDGKLYNVLLAPRDKKDANEYTGQALENLLVQKYGRPWKSETAMGTHLEWSIGTTIIRLTTMVSQEFNLYALTLQYIRKSDDPL